MVKHTPLPAQTGTRRHYVLNLSVRPSVRLFVRPFSYKLVNTIFCQRMNGFRCKLALSSPRDNGMKWSTLGVRRSKIKVMWGQTQIRTNHSRPLRSSRLSTGCFRKKVAPSLKLFGIFSLRLTVFAWNFANLLAVHSHIYLPIFVDLS